ncbi:aminopeptidase [Candidatus Woesearchaeota archaeon]|nr:aminopeptidase [Candidatus Woesearchaeota archaeon]
MDPRIKKLANILVNHSLKIKKDDIIDVNCGIEAKDLALEISRLILLKGAFPRVNCGLPGFAYTYFKNATNEQLSKKPELRIYEAEKIAGTISIGTENNTKELSNIAPEKIALRRKATKPISDIVIKKDNWVICDMPTNAMAQDAEMSLEEFEDFVYSACLRDWKKEERIQTNLKKVLDKGKQVRIIGPNTDLTFSIEGRQGIKCFGKRNMPDGEVFIAPVEDTTEGYIHYDFPVCVYGKEIDNIKLEFKKGKVVKATASKNQDLLRKMIKIDPGACKLGEFGIGTNFGIKKFIKSILFDEKIGGTIHLALGMAYPEGGGQNKSALHWDMIKDLRKGGKFMIDGKVIQENGKFKIKMG